MSSPNSRIVIEACVGRLEDALQACHYSDRLEFCSQLEVGGLTPCVDEVSDVRDRAGIPFVVMIRQRPGDFRYSDAEWRQMLFDADRLLKAGAMGVVFGALTANRRIDAERVRQMRDLVRSIPSREVVFHRAIDETKDVVDAFQELARLDVDRVLSSGGAPTAMEGLRTLRTLVEKSFANANRPQVLVAGGVRSHNVRQILRETGCRQIHSACTKSVTKRKRPRLELNLNELDDLYKEVQRFREDDATS